MNLIHHPKRYLLDTLVGLVLGSMLLFGSVYIYRLNSDSRDLVFDSQLAMQGQQSSNNLGCVACHTVDGSPPAKIVEGFPNVMARYYLEEPEITALIEYIKALGNPVPPAAQ